jgi:hypothetical protein
MSLNEVGTNALICKEVLMRELNTQGLVGPAMQHSGYQRTRIEIRMGANGHHGHVSAISRFF